MSALATERLCKNFLGVQALRELSIEFAEGQCTGLIGPNGSGKSTLLHVASGLVPISDGAIILSKQRLDCIKPHQILKYGMSRTFQDGRLIGQMSVLDNLLLAMAERKPFRALFQFRKNEDLARAEEMLRRVSLWDKKDVLANGLSYGQRKLLEITRAMATGADTYLLDEPFSGLFPEAIEIIVGLIEDMKKKGKTIVLIEHSMDLITRLCDHVIVMDAGKLLAQGKPQEVLHNTDVLEAYLGK
ncbi:MAG: ABC transporter ATP-binding protein [Alphaproteobacteria bacterium]|jgi:branched-chain amino acid transport system ATP-binding protein|nr:ABC transporter ATP-binding protein [Alphaproteobacteria bacterium]